MHGWDGEFDIKCETEFRAQGKRLGKHLSDMFPSAFDNQKGFISAKSEIWEISNTCIWLYLPVHVFGIICKVQGCRVRRSCHYAIEGQLKTCCAKMEEIAKQGDGASNSVLGILFSEFTNPCPVGTHPAKCVESGNMCQLLSAWVCLHKHRLRCNFSQLLPDNSGPGSKTGACGESQENTMMHIEKASKNVLGG